MKTQLNAIERLIIMFGYFVLNIVLFTFSIKYLDRKEIIYTLIAIIVSSTALLYTEGVETVFTNDTLLASVFAGLFVGMGIGLIFRSGGTMGGTTIIARILILFFSMSYRCAF